MTNYYIITDILRRYKTKDVNVEEALLALSIALSSIFYTCGFVPIFLVLYFQPLRFSIRIFQCRCFDVSVATIAIGI